MFEEDLFEEIRFAKTQQWKIAALAGTSLAAIFVVAHTMGHLQDWEKWLGTIFVGVVVFAAGWVLCSLQNHLAEKRREIDIFDLGPWSRGADVLAVLILSITIAAFVVGYSLWRPSVC
jgi:hypothetical protein